jgi:hypothetical protein
VLVLETDLTTAALLTTAKVLEIEAVIDWLYWLLPAPFSTVLLIAEALRDI